MAGKDSERRSQHRVPPLPRGVPLALGKAATSYGEAGQGTVSAVNLGVALGQARSS